MIALGLVCALASQSFANFPNRIKDAEDELFGQALPLVSTGVPTWKVSEPYINFWIVDQPLTYTTSYGQPIGFGVCFKQRNLRSNSKIFGLGPSWESSWLSYIEYTTSGTNATPGTNYIRLGGARVFLTDGTKEFKSSGKMTKLADGSGVIGFRIDYPSGAQEIYTNRLEVSASENYAMLSDQIDSVGRAIHFTYDMSGGWAKLTEMTDFDGKISTIVYDTTYSKQIKEVDDPYGRKAYFGYDGNGRLNTITNVGGLNSSFSYDGQGLITSLVTPYGTTSFTATTNMVDTETLGGNNVVNRSVLVTLPDGNKELFLYRDQSTKLNSGSTTDLIPASFLSGDVPVTSPLSNTLNNSYQDARNSFHWNTKQYDGLSSTFKSSGNFNDLTLADYRIARRNHWLRRYNNEDIVTDTLSLQQATGPDGNTWGQKVWFDYIGKVTGQNWTRGTDANPRFEALVLPNGLTHYTYTERNVWEKPTRIVDTYTSGSSVAARTNNFIFASNNIDLTEWRGPSGELISSNAYNGVHQVIAHYNAVNDLTTYNYDSSHRLVDAHFPTGLSTTNFYYTGGTNVGWLQKTVDYDGITPVRTNTFSSYYKGLPEASTDARGLFVTGVWDDLQRLSTLTVPSGTYTNQYNKLELEKVIDPVNSTNRLTFDAMRRLTAVIDAQSTNSFKYTGGLVSDSTNALQQVEKYDYDLNGHVLKVTYPDTAFMNQRFSLLGQLTNQTDVVGSVRSYTYNNQGLLAASSNAFGQVLLRKYDIRDRVTNEVDSRGVSVSITYDTLGRVLTWTYPDNGVEKFEYSPRGLITYTNQLGFVTRFSYDVLGRRTSVTNPNNEVVSNTYNPAGDVLTITDGKNQTTWFNYDIYGRLTAKAVNTQTNEILRFQYDAAGRMTNRWTIAKGNTEYRYDEVSNLTNINYPNSPDVTLGYDPLKRFKSMKDGYTTLWGTNNQITFTYNTAGVLLSEAGPWDANPVVAYEYWTNDVRKQFVVQQKDGTYWTNRYGYDAALRLNDIRTPAGMFTNIFSSGVLPGTTCGSAMIQKMILPNGAYITNAYDTVARLAFTKLFNSGNTLLNSHAYLYNQGNQRTNQTRWDGSYVDYTYDNIGQLRTALGKESGGTSRLNEQFSYGYDAAWNLTCKTNNALIQTNGPNNRNQLTSIVRSGTFTVSGNTTVAATSVTVNGSAAARYGDNTYAKDGLSLVSGNNTFTAIAEDSQGRRDTNVITANLPTTVSFSYDSNGNLLSDGLRGFDYDDENRLTRITVTNSWKSEFFYDGLGRRRMRNEYLWFNGSWAWNNQVQYVYDGNVVVQERWGGDEPWVNYTRGPDLSGSWQGAGGIGGLLAWSQKVNGVYQSHYYHADGNGNVTAMVNGSQVVSARYLYDPYGNLLASSGGMADVNVYRFSSQEFHDKSGLYGYAMRFYEPRLGRWLNGDPLREGGGINFYGFCGGDPINRIDPWGLESKFHTTLDDWRNGRSLTVEATRLLAAGFGLPLLITDKTQTFALAYMDALLRELSFQEWLATYEGVRDATAEVLNIWAGAGAFKAVAGIGESLLSKVVTGGAKGAGAAATDAAAATVSKVVSASPQVVGAAAKTGMNIASGSKQLIAQGVDDVLLGVVENGNVSFFKTAAGQIEGHADLVKAGLVQPGAQGFSIGVKNGEVTALFRNSMLNPASANYNLPAQTAEQILQALGAAGAKVLGNP